MRHLRVSVQRKNQRNAWLISLPFVIPCTAVATRLFNTSHARHWKSCVPRPASPAMKQAELHQTWWMITCRYKGLNLDSLGLKRLIVKWIPNLRFQRPYFRKEQIKNQNTSCQSKGHNLAASSNGRGCQGYLCTVWHVRGASSLPGWSSLLGVTPGSAGRGRELVQLSWWKNKTTLQRDTVNKYCLARLSPPAT